MTSRQNSIEDEDAPAESIMLVFCSAGPVQCLYRNIRGAAAHCCGCDDRVHADCERLPVHLPHTHSVRSAVEKHGVHHHQHTQACRAFDIQAASGLGVLESAFRNGEEFK